MDTAPYDAEVLRSLSDNDNGAGLSPSKPEYMVMTEKHLEMFEQAVRKQAELVGRENALHQAKLAGLGISAEGRVVNCTGHPMIVLLRLIRTFTKDGNLAALTQCTDLIKEMEKMAESLEAIETPENA